MRGKLEEIVLVEERKENKVGLGYKNNIMNGQQQKWDKEEKVLKNEKEIKRQKEKTGKKEKKGLN